MLDLMKPKYVICFFEKYTKKIRRSTNIFRHAVYASRKSMWPNVILIDIRYNKLFSPIPMEISLLF